jgi:hypothetical protein
MQPTTDDRIRMEIRISDDVRAFVRERGGRLFVWATAHRCCTGPLTLLDTDTEPPGRRQRQFRRIEADGFELYVDAGHRRLPERLTLEMGRWPRKVRAFWNDLAFVD